MSDQANKNGTNNTIASAVSDQPAAIARSKSPPHDQVETQTADATTTLSIAVPNATVRLIRIVAAASDATMGRTISTLLAGAVEREMPGIIRGLQAK